MARVTDHSGANMVLGGGFNIFYFHPYLGKIPILTNTFQMGWNHQPVVDLFSQASNVCQLQVLSFGLQICSLDG